MVKVYHVAEQVCQNTSLIEITFERYPIAKIKSDVTILNKYGKNGII